MTKTLPSFWAVSTAADRAVAVRNKHFSSEAGRLPSARTAFSGCRGITQTAPDRGTCVPLREPRFYPQKYGAFSANSAIVSRSISRKNMSRLRIKQTSTPSCSQPLSLRARHLPLPQGTALMMTALTRGTSFKQLSTHTPFRQNSQHTISPCARKFRLAEFAAKPADFRG